VSRLSRAIVLLAFLGFGCGDSRNRTPPLAPSTSAPAVSQQSLSGYVADTAFRAVTGARVEVLDGPQAGLSMVSDAVGQFTYTGTFTSPVSFRVSKDGYISATETSRVSAPGGRPWAYVRLETVAAPADIAGDYTMTVIADSVCTGIPEEWRTRTYAATIGPRLDPLLRPNTLLTLTVVGAPLLPNRDNFPIGVSASDIGFTIYQGEDFGLVEQLTPTTFLAVQGFGLASIDGSASTITAMLNGVIDYCALKSESGWNYNCTTGPAIAHASCESKNHRLTLRQR
jgi:hypothetical protein